MKRLCRLAAAAFGFSVIVSAASAQGTKLIFTTIASPTAELGIETYHEWADRINAQGKGIVDIDVRDGSVLANSANFADRLREDVVQISFGSLNYLAGKFQLSVFTALPFILNSAEESSVVFWRIYKSGALDSEFDEMMPLFIQAYPPNSLHFVKPQPGAIKDLNGLKVLASGKIPTEVVSLLGGAPLSIPLTDSYQALQRGTGDGLYFPFGALQDFKLDEVTHYHIVAPFGGGTGGVWMMKKKYVSLPEAVRKLIDDNSGEAQSRRAGQILDRLQIEATNNVTAAKDQTVVTLNPEQVAAWKVKTAPLLTEWSATSPAHAKLLQLVQTEAAKFRAESK